MQTQALIIISKRQDKITTYNKDNKSYFKIIWHFITENIIGK
jgi:hypothetical protein